MSETFFVVCDANGECKGIYTNEDLANTSADYYGAYVSKHSPQESLNKEVTDWLNKKGK